jgi:hypothetical protein
VDLARWWASLRLGRNGLPRLSGVEDYEIALATYRTACERWFTMPITLPQGARVIQDSRRLRIVSSDQGRQGGR